MNTVARDGPASGIGTDRASSHEGGASVDAVVELSRELRRLAVAGVGLARGDHRIAALVPVLERGGEKVAVLARIAERTKALLAASKPDAPADLLRLNTLVGAVLRTQGRSGIDGDLAPLPPPATTPRRIPMRALIELYEGLHDGGTSALYEAIERGWFDDARLAPFAFDALASDNATLANLAAERLVPSYGELVVPRLVASLDLSLRRPAARIIETVARADAGSGTALARQVLDPDAERVFALATDGVNVSDEAHVAALGLLADDTVDRAVLVDFLDARRKALRVASLSRLIALGDDDAEARVVAMLDGSATKVREAIESIPALTSDAVTSRVFAMAQSLTTSLRTKPRSARDVADAARVMSLIARSRPDPERFESAFALFKSLERGEMTRSRFGDAVDCLMSICPDGKFKPLVRAAMARNPGRTVIATIRRLGPREALPLLLSTRKRHREQGLRYVFVHRSREYPTANLYPLPPASEWGEDWLALALGLELHDLVEHLWSLDPAMTSNGILKYDVIGARDIPIALIADPGCAVALRRRLQEEFEAVEYTDAVALCGAVADDDREKSLQLALSLRSALPSHFLFALHARLVEYFADPSARPPNSPETIA